MKNSHLLSLAAILGLSAVPLHAAVFATDFETLFVSTDLNGQGGWTTTEATAEATYVTPAGGSFGTQAGSIGYVTPVSASEVYTKNSFGGAVNLSMAEFSVLFAVYDSTNGQAARDTFGFRLADSSGSNLFSFFLNPIAQSGTPESTLGQWSFAYTTGSGPQVPFYANPEQTQLRAADEDLVYNMTISFAEVGLSGDVQMNLKVNGLTYAGGVLDNAAASTINEVGVFWRPTSGPSSTGDNVLVFDNMLVAVPEPGVAGLAGMAGLLCLMARRRA